MVTSTLPSQETSSHSSFALGVSLDTQHKDERQVYDSDHCHCVWWWWWWWVVVVVVSKSSERGSGWSNGLFMDCDWSVFAVAVCGHLGGKIEIPFYWDVGLWLLTLTTAEVPILAMKNIADKMLLCWQVKSCVCEVTSWCLHALTHPPQQAREHT